MEKICPTCNGTGFIFTPGLEKKTCSRCNGTGRISDNEEQLYPTWSAKKK